jgi:hypothetical protein
MLRPSVLKPSVGVVGLVARPSFADVWSFACFNLAMLLAAAAIAGEGLGRPGLNLGLRLTARLAFLAFWPSYTAGALVVLFGRSLEPLKLRARGLGLAFVTVLVVHLGLVIGRCAIGAPPSARQFILFGPAAVCALLLAAASLKSVSRVIGWRGWWLLRNLAMNYIAFVFMVDFARRAPLYSARGVFEYAPFAMLAFAGPALRGAAYFKRRSRSDAGPV